MSEILLTDKKFFKDDLEHPYECDCMDGLATCTRIECEENKGCPETLLLGYPKMSELSEARKASIKDWFGFPDGEDIIFEDVAVKYGKIGRSGLGALELNTLDKIARRAKMDWFVTTDEGNFKDGDTGKPMSPRKAVKELIEGVDVDRHWFDELNDGEKLTLVRALAKLL